MIQFEGAPQIHDLSEIICTNSAHADLRDILNEERYCGGNKKMFG